MNLGRRIEKDSMFYFCTWILSLPKTWIIFVYFGRFIFVSSCVILWIRSVAAHISPVVKSLNCDIALTPVFAIVFYDSSEKSRYFLRHC